jgi:hypothetical protein
MEPMLHTGDLVLASRNLDYRTGDLVVYANDTGLVIHRLDSGSPETGWRTKGDNNDWVDSWTVPDQHILGEFRGAIPRAGSLIAWIGDHPIGFAAVMSLLLGAAYLPRRRHRRSPALQEALAHATRQRPGAWHDGGEKALLLVCAVAMLIGLAAFTLAYVTGALLSVAGIAAAGAVLTGGAGAWWLEARLYDGRGLPEPAASRCALSGNLYRIAECPEAKHVVEVGSALELRELADRARVPVLVVESTTEAQDTFLVMADDDTTYVWTPRAGSARLRETTASR